MRRYILPAFAVFAAPVPAGAVGFMTQLSCASDYYAYCSQHEVGSPGLRKCMNDNGPRLSSSCINALISDGEITKEEVMRRRDQYLASKAQPKGEAKIAAKAASAPKQIVTVGLPEVRAPMMRKPQPTDVVVTNALVLDQRTFLALKNRGDRFVIDGAIPPSDPAPRAIATITEPAVAVADAGEDAEADAVAAPPIAAAVPPVAAAEALDQPPTKDMPGKMALGKKQTVEAPPPPVVEEVLVPRKPSSAEIWMNYMQNRFDGGMNYEGVDANF